MNEFIIPKNRHPFIVLEGIDGVGKSTIAQLVAKALAGCYYKTPSSPFDFIRISIDSLADPIGRFYFYLSSVYHASKEINELLNQRPVVCDRYIYSTFAYHFAIDERLRQSTLPQPLLSPDLSILLSADEVERKARLARRGTPSPQCELASEKDDSFLRRVEREFQAMPLVRIDTSKRTPESITTEIVAKLEHTLFYRRMRQNRHTYECTTA